MLERAIDDARVICRDELGEARAARLFERARVSAADASELNAHVLADMPPDERQRAVAINLWQFTWLELAAVIPNRFPGARDDDIALELAVRYGREREGSSLRGLALTTAEEAQLTEARNVLANWTGLSELLLDPPSALVVSDECRALRHALEPTLGQQGAMALRAPDLRHHTLIGAHVVTRCRARDSEISELALLLLHEELHVALSVSSGRVTHNGWALLMHTAEEAVVLALELATEWWMWTSGRPAREDILERATWHCYGNAVCGLMRALPDRDEDCIEPLARLAGAIADCGDDDDAVAALNRCCQTELTQAQWLSALASPRSLL